MAVCLQYWPQLSALYLLGLLGREGSIHLAAWAGHNNNVWASLIMPLAGLARLGSYVGMFLVLRPAFPEFAADPVRPRRGINLFGSVIVPFFAIYLAWQMFKEDWLAFESQALQYRIDEAMTSTRPTELHADTLPVSGTTLVIILVALATRMILRRLSERLPKWTVILRVYVDALWVFMVLTFSVNRGVTLLTNPSGWVKERRVVVWLNDLVNSALTPFHPLQVAWRTVTGAAGAVFGGAAVPLMWLAVAGIVYGISTRTTWLSAGRRVAGNWADVVSERTARRRGAWKKRWDALPKALRDSSREDAADKLGKYKPLAESARTIAHGGLCGLSVYVLAYLILAWLDMSGSYYSGQLGSGYLFRGMAMLLGPHPIEFWNGVGGGLALLSHLIVEPLRISVVATAFAYCVHHSRLAAQKSHHQAEQDHAPRTDDVDGRGGGVGGDFKGQLQ
jgi:hypothetical protein